MQLRKTGNIKKLIFFDSYGMMSLSFFLIALVSGIFLAIPFDIENPYSSIGRLLIANPWASLFRNLHYWSAQFFLVLAVLHIWDYLKKSKEISLRKGVWFRLVISILFIFLLMLSGFILKADADSMQARRILESLLSSIPVFGDLISYTVLGSEGDFQLIYVHHLATTSIFLVIIIIEHAKTIWGSLRTFIILLAFTTVLSIFFQAPLHNNLDPVMKGPWYFLGLQEILHWLSYPGISLMLITGILILIYFLPSLRNRPEQLTRNLILYSFWAYLLLSVTGNFFRGENWRWQWPWNEGINRLFYNPFNPLYAGTDSYRDSLEISGIPVVLGREEGCLVCHSGMKGFSPAHDPEAIGCVSCHGGNSFSLNKVHAHRNMILIPGNNTDAARSCGTTDCHPDIPVRVKSSMMSSLSGMITVDRFVFGEALDLNELSHVSGLGQSAADNHLRDLCASCHLGNEKTETGPVTQLSRGGGCNACHLDYSDSSLKAHNDYHSTKRQNNYYFNSHPSLSINISNDHCFGCHSRSGRISTNYEGWHETQLDEHDSLLDNPGFRVLEDHRVFMRMEDDIHHRKGMACIDCHTSYELMGDGNIYRHKEDQLKVSCEDCHTKNPGKTFFPGEFDSESKKIHDLRAITDQAHRYLSVLKSGDPLVNTFINNDSLWLYSKLSGNLHPVLPPAEICTRGEAHDDLGCSACHTSWAPRCLGCHTEYEPHTTGYDIYANKYTKGSWVEYAGKYMAIAPTLGVELHNRKNIETEKVRDKNKSDRIIKPAIPGMVMTLDKDMYPKRSGANTFSFHRLFSPAGPHTIQAEGRSCKSCHNDPVTLGYGEGKLSFNNESRKWSFTPRYELNKHDNLPEDAWIPFLGERRAQVSTRNNFRPFSLNEQKRILTVGVCLNCHNEDSDIMMRSLDDFQELLKQLSPECKLPKWDN